MYVLRGRYGLAWTWTFQQATIKKSPIVPDFGRFSGFGLVFTKMSTIFVGKWDRFAPEFVIADKLAGWLADRKEQVLIRKLRHCKWQGE